MFHTCEMIGRSVACQAQSGYEDEMYLRLCAGGLVLLTLIFGILALIETPAPPPSVYRTERLWPLTYPKNHFTLRDAIILLKDMDESRAKAETTGASASASSSHFGDVLRVVPAKGPISSEFGPRVLISFSRPRMHSGVDILAPRGTPVLAAGDGIVAFSGRNGTYGVLVEIDHGGGLATCYGHMDKTLVKAGQAVTAGEQIGVVGKTGKTTGPNLHFEVRVNDKCINPREAFTWPPSPPRKPKPQLP